MGNERRFLNAAAWALVAIALTSGAPKPQAGNARNTPMISSQPVAPVQLSEPQATALQQRELAAQERMAVSAERMIQLTWLQIAIGVLGTIGLAVTVLFTARTLRQTQKALRHTEETSRQQLRPYLAVCKYVGARFIVGRKLKCDFRLRNYGGGATKDLHVSYFATIAKAAPRRLPVGPFPEVPIKSRDLVPGDEAGLFYETDIVLTPAMKARLERSADYLMIAILAEYSDAFDRKHRLEFSVFLYGKGLADNRHNPDFLSST